MTFFMTKLLQTRPLAIQRAAPALLLAVLAASAQAATFEGLRFEDSARLAGQDLRLNGLGLRRMLFVKVYAAALYLPAKAGTLAAVAAQAGPKRLQLRMLHAAGPDDFIDALLPGIRNNTSPAQQAALAERLAQLERTIRAIGHTAVGDVIDFDYAVQGSTQLSVNGQAKGAVIAGADFYSAVLGIFVGEQPVDAGLKKGLLGGP